MIQNRFGYLRHFKKHGEHTSENITQQVIDMSKQLRFNAEHVVPQSWFGATEPMKGDLHHLFVCEPSCNTARSNFPYFDYEYVSVSDSDATNNTCGIFDVGRFEPRRGKGAVARATLYFLLRYPNKIKKKFLKSLDTSLLVKWHAEFPPDEFEKHRNQAIYEIQGNRNPLIDIPELTERLSFDLIDFG